MSRGTKGPLVRSVVGFAAATALAASAITGTPAVATPETSSRAASAAVVPEDLTFTAVLRYDRRKLLADAKAISTPGNARYRNFLTVKQAAAKFGLSRSQRVAMRAAAEQLGVTVSFSATRMTADLTAPIAVWNRIYGMEATTIRQDPWLNYVYLDSQGNFPPVPATLRSFVRLIFADAAVLDRQAKATRTPVDLLSTDDTRPLNLGTPFGPGAECVYPKALPRTYSPMQIHTPYGTKALQERGLTGSGARIANLAGGYAYTYEYLEHFADCFEFRAPPIRFTGGPGVGPEPVRTSGDTEGNLDIQVIAAVVPDIARIDFIQVANATALPLSFVQGIDIALTRLSPLPDVLTSSFGTCDLDLAGSDGALAASDDHFALAGIVGVSVLSAAGDGGSSSCTQFTADPPANLRVASTAYPGSSPWVTGVGGTRLVLGEQNRRVDEFVWNDTPWGPANGAGAGGSALSSRPWYQKPVTAQDRRLVPDVAAHASAFSAWAAADFYEGELTVLPFAGTSAASPFVAANLALLAAAERKAGRGPLGFVNPMLYALAEKPTVYKDAFYDVTSGSNQIYLEAGCCLATKGYDQASGLGSLTFDQLIKVIPRPGRR